jgi:hypothetical protein
MTIASRTAEGFCGPCPVCSGYICMEPLAESGDAPCPYCQHQLWFVHVDDGYRWYEKEAVTPAKIAAIEALRDCGSLNGIWAECDFDSIDFFELALEVESRSGYRLPADDVRLGKLESWGELIDYIVRELPDEPG